MKHFLNLVIVLALLLACGGVTAPPTGPGTAYPCGVQGKSCGHHMCCGQYDDCGGVVLSCPEGYCCYNGEDSMLSARKPKKQWSEGADAAP